MCLQGLLGHLTRAECNVMNSGSLVEDCWDLRDPSSPFLAWWLTTRVPCGGMIIFAEGTAKTACFCFHLDAKVKAESSALQRKIPVLPEQGQGGAALYVLHQCHAPIRILLFGELPLVLPRCSSQTISSLFRC
jgi:hypothetical protein